jgi:ketosteroid isomerase-like protein
MTAPAPPSSRAERFRLLCGQLDAMSSAADRTDPLDETVLCLAESAALAAKSAELAAAGPPGSAPRRQALAEALAAARAAVVCMTYALAAEPGVAVDWSRRMTEKSTLTVRAVPSVGVGHGVGIEHSVGADQVRRFYECVDTDDVTALVDLFTEDCVYHRPGYAPWLGRAGLTRFYTEARVIRSGKHTLTALLSDGPNVAAHGEFDGLLHSGDEVHLRFADFFELAPDGRFSRRFTYYFAPLA